MKKFLVKSPAKLCRALSLSLKSIPVILMFLLLSGFSATAQSLPTVSVRFANPHYDCQSGTYCVDVEFMSDTPDQQLFGVNVRFFYDDNILEYLGMSEFETGYGEVGVPEIITGTGGSFWGFAGPPEWINGSVQKLSSSGVMLTSQWHKYFKICFSIDDPAYLNIENFCPSLVWDLQLNPPPENPGFLPGDDGVVITLVLGEQDSSPTTENVVQFNWVYNPEGFPFGNPVSDICETTICWKVPISNWALFLGIGLMMIATLFIYRRRIS